MHELPTKLSGTFTANLFFKFQAEAFTKSRSNILSLLLGPAFFQNMSAMLKLYSRVEHRSLPTMQRRTNRVGQALSVKACLCASDFCTTVISPTD